MASGEFALEPRGPFTLASAARFISGWTPATGVATPEDVRLHFLCDDLSGDASVVMRQDGDGTVRVSIDGGSAAYAERVVAQAAQGRLDREALLAAGQEEALARLRELPGIGPFWADGVYLRAVGPADGLTLREPRVRAKAAEHYDAPEVVEDDDAFVALAERWRPFRTWVTVLLRAAG